MDTASLRARVLHALTTHADLRAATFLEHATLHVDEAVRRWTSSAGEVCAHRVSLAVDARRLGELKAAPSIEDSLHAAFAAVLSESGRESLAELRVAWDGALSARIESYRGATRLDGRAHVIDALAEYLDGAGDTGASWSVAHAEALLPSPDELALTGSPDAWTATAIRDAARHLFGDALKIRWRSR